MLRLKYCMRCAATWAASKPLFASLAFASSHSQLARHPIDDEMKVLLAGHVVVD